MDAEVDERTAMSAQAQAQAQAPRRAARLRWALMGGGVLLAIVAGLWYYLASGRYVSTDDSSIQAAQATISSSSSQPGHAPSRINLPLENTGIGYLKKN